MTVSELIVELQMYPKDATVMLWNSDARAYGDRIGVGVMSDDPEEQLGDAKVVVLDMYCEEGIR